MNLSYKSYLLRKSFGGRPCRVPRGVPIRLLSDGSLIGLTSCGSLTDCAHCRAKISGRRFRAISDLTLRLDDIGCKHYLLTLTLSHSSSDKLADLLGSTHARSGLLGAFHIFARTRFFKSFRKSVVGMIRALEVTWSPLNGFHPHLHVGFSLPGGSSPPKAKDFINNWLASLGTVGLSASRAHGCDVRCVHDALEYTSKFCTDKVALELSGFSRKEGRAKGKTIVTLEDDFLAGNTSLYPVIAEYRKAMFGRRHLTISGYAGFRFSDCVADDEHSEFSDAVTLTYDPASVLAYSREMGQSSQLFSSDVRQALEQSNLEFLTQFDYNV